MVDHLNLSRTAGAGGLGGSILPQSTSTRLVSFELHYFGAGAAAPRVVMCGTLPVICGAGGGMKEAEKIIALIKREAMNQVAEMDKYSNPDQAVYQVVITHQFEI